MSDETLPSRHKVTRREVLRGIIPYAATGALSATTYSFKDKLEKEEDALRNQRTQPAAKPEEPEEIVRLLEKPATQTLESAPAGAIAGGAVGVAVQHVIKPQFDSWVDKHVKFYPDPNDELKR